MRKANTWHRLQSVMISINFFSKGNHRLKTVPPARRFFLPLIVLIVLLSTFQSVVGQNIKPPDDKETVQQLLTEVRMLRQALQMVHRMSLDTYRSQLLVDRIRAIREDIQRLTASLADTREVLAKTQSTIPQFIERHKMLESRAQLEVDQNKKAEYEFEAKQVKDGVERYKSQVELLKEREQQLVTDINAAKAKVEELENRLDALERAMENDRQTLEEKARQPKTP